MIKVQSAAKSRTSFDRCDSTVVVHSEQVWHDKFAVEALMVAGQSSSNGPPGQANAGGSRGPIRRACVSLQLQAYDRGRV